MLGHYLLTLTPEQEDRVLTGKMAPGAYGRGSDTRCLIGCVTSGRPESAAHKTYWPDVRRIAAVATAYGFVWPGSVEHRYDTACFRFGVGRINTVIRNRILSNQARRSLAGQRELLPCR